MAHYAAARGSNGELMDVGERHTEHDGGTWTNMKDASSATRLMPIRVVRLRLELAVLREEKRSLREGTTEQSKWQPEL